jgi:O-antigen ligase/Tfp pilus assembly protein PilF
MTFMEKKSIFDWGIRGGLFLLIVLVPLFFSFQLTTYSLPKIAITQILVCILFTLWFLKMVMAGRFSVGRSMLFLPLLIYFILAIFSLFSAISLPGGVSLLWQIFSYILIYFIVINHVQEKELETWVLLISLVGILMSGYGILQYFGIEPLLKGYYYRPHVPVSTLGHTSQVAQYLILLIPLCGCFFFLSSSWIKRVVLGISTTMMVYHLFLTKSRGGMLGFLLSLIFFIGIEMYRELGRVPFFQRRRWFLLLFLVLLTPLLFITFPKTITLKAKHINPIGYYVHSIDGSKIPKNQSIRIEFDYQVVQGSPQKPGYLNLYGEQTNSEPIYLTHHHGGWHSVKREDISFSSTPYEEDIKLRWVPGGEGSVLRLRKVTVQTKGGIDLIKDPFLNRLFSKLGVTEVDKVLSSQARLYMYRNTLEMIKHHFFLGAGFGNFKYVYPRYRDRGEWALSGLNTRVEQAHNEYLQIFSEVGLIGFLAFILILGTVARMSWTTIRRADSHRHFFINLALTMGIVATLVQSFFDFGLQNPASGVMFWMMIGFLEVIYHSVKKSQSQEAPPLNHLLLSSKGARWGIGVGIGIVFTLGIFFSVRPVLGDGYLKWGRFFMDHKDWGRAYDHFEKASLFSPNDFDVFFHLGQTSDRLKDYEGAVNYYKRAILLFPYFIEARNNLGAVYIKLGQIDEAIEEFKGSIEINPYHPGLHNNLGYLYSKRNLFKNAMEEYYKVLELDPRNPEVHKNLGLLFFYKLKDYPKAKEYWEKYLVLNPGDPEREAIRYKIEEIKKGKVPPG